MAQGERTRKRNEWKALLEEERDLVKGVVQEALQEVLEAEMDDALQAGKWSGPGSGWAIGAGNTAGSC